MIWDFKDLVRLSYYVPTITRTILYRFISIMVWITVFVSDKVADSNLDSRYLIRHFFDLASASFTMLGLVFMVTGFSLLAKLENLL